MPSGAFSSLGASSSSAGGASTEGAELDEGLLSKVASSLAEILVESKDKPVTSEQRLDLDKLEEILTSNKIDLERLNELCAGVKGGQPSAAASKETGQVGPLHLTSGDKKDSDTSTTTGKGSSSGDRFSEASAQCEPPEDARDALPTILGVGSPKESKDKAAQAGAVSSKDGPEAGRGRKEMLEDFIRQVLQSRALRRPNEKSKSSSSSISRLRGKLAERANFKDSKDASASSLSLAEHAKEIGNWYLKERDFAAAARWYEVACLLFPAGAAPAASSTSQLAACHCNCALACLELGRYGDVISEGHAALRLTPPTRLAVKALYRLAIAHTALKNAFQARRCLRRCLQLEPKNEFACAFLKRLEEQELRWLAAQAMPFDGGDLHCHWAEQSKRGHGLVAAKEKCKGKKTKTRGGLGEDVGAEKEAGMWHAVASFQNKLYILGGYADPGNKADESKATLAAWISLNQNQDSVLGVDELQVLDVDTMELRSLGKCPQQCFGHTAVLAGSNLVFFAGASGPQSRATVTMYDILQGKWKSQPASGIPPRQRHGHSACAVLDDRYVCVFGGMELTQTQRTARVFNDVQMLDLQSCAWRKLQAGGVTPTARFGHTATLLPGHGNRVLVVGGRDHLEGIPEPGSPHCLTDLHILDIDRRMWQAQHFTGPPPEQAFYHAATLLDAQTLLVVGSGSTGSEAIPLHVLDLEAWSWSELASSGPAPPPHVGHSAVLVGRRMYMFGGTVRAEGAISADKAVHVLEMSIAQEAKHSDDDDIPATSGHHAKAHADFSFTYGSLEPPGSSMAGNPLASVPSISPSSSTSTGIPGAGGCAGTSRPSPLDMQRECIERMLAEDGFEDGDEDEPELSFEELLAKEKAFFQSHSEKISFPRAGPRRDNGNGVKKGKS